MFYKSTRDSSIQVAAPEAIARGLSADGGLFVPVSLPRIGHSRMERLLEMNYRERACDILADFLPEFDEAEIRESVEAAYGSQWASKKIVPLSKLSPDVYMLELWHGPTCAFKDVALQLLPHLLTLSAKKTAGGKTIDILVATSGDTGKAALEGFRDVEGTNIIVFYPNDGVSQVQKLQMVTQQGENVGVCAVHGNFDDTQTAVKKIFTDPALISRLEEKNAMFSSANSINWGRLLPQIVYYFSAYCDLVNAEEIELGGKVNITVPTGNFGNILAAYYAKHMGLPVNRLICASNVNKVLTDFIGTGTYDRRREFVLTSSPSMDILISSNLERLLYALTDEDDEAVGFMMGDLVGQGYYTVTDEVLKKLRTEFYGGFCDEAGTAATIKKTFQGFSYLLDPHTAVALHVYEDYVARTKDDTKTIIASTANPFKFAGSILAAMTGKPGEGDEFAQLERLTKLTGVEPPPQILDLKAKPVRFDTVCAKEDMPGAVCRMLGL